MDTSTEERFDLVIEMPPTAVISAERARELVSQINACMNDARAKLLELYEGEGWKPLGYSSWRECVISEFQQSKTYLYNQLEAAKIERQISSIEEIGQMPETHLRPLQAVKNYPEQVQEAWELAQEKAQETPRGVLTAAIVAEAVKEVQAEHMEPPGKGGRDTVLKPAILGIREPVSTVEVFRGAAVQKFNETNDNVEWALWTWNPVTGCLHDCNYCYARDIATRHYNQGFVPTFHPDRLTAPQNMKVPAGAAQNIGLKNVFVCSMADLFGKWVPEEWIEAVFSEVRNAPDWNFLFLTKFPQRLADFNARWPDNAWVGTTVDSQQRVATAEKAFARVTAGIKWLSCEPMMERLTFSQLDTFDWVVMGGASRSSQTAEFKPPFDWINHLYNQARAAGCQVYMKTNLGIENPVRVREYPGNGD